MGPEYVKAIALEQKLFSITEELDTDILKFINPVNAVEERKRFFKHAENGKEYNPLFAYLPKNPIFSHFTLSPEFSKIMKELNGLKLNEEGAGKLIEKKRLDLIKKMELIRCIGTSKFTEKSAEFYGKPGKELLQQAKTLVKWNEESESETKNAEETASEMENEFKHQEILDWNVKLDENQSSHACVLPFQKILRIRKDSKFSEKGIQRLKVHEIHTHIYRYLNGAQQPYKFFVNGTDRNWQLTEEGLAVINEQIFGLSSQENIKEYAGRVIAIEHALEHSFYETFQYLKEWFSPEKAYQLTQRVKRGLFNTVHEGAFTKDYFYLEGRDQVSEFLKKGGDITQLYYGKISFKDVELLNEIPELIKPKYVPNYPENILEKIREK